MNKETAKIWANALLSGNYKQGGGYLKAWYPEQNEYRFCCLGVLGEELAFLAQNSSLKVIDNVFVKQYDLFERESDEQCAFICLNDGVSIQNQDVIKILNEMGILELGSKRYSFEEIADIIKRFYGVGK